MTSKKDAEYVLVVRLAPSKIAKANKLPAPAVDQVEFWIDDLLTEEEIGYEWFVKSVTVPRSETP